MEWMAAHWLWCVAGFWMLEKIVKMTPTKYDDILVDIVWGGIRRALGKGK